MRTLSWLLRGLIFVLLLGLLVRNGDPVTLRLFFGPGWQIPLSLALLLFFTAGVFLTALFLLPGWLRMRRDLGRLKRELPARDAGAAE